MKLEDRDFHRLADFVQEYFGINLTEKRTLIECRLSFDIGQRGYDSFGQYIDLVVAGPDGDECQHMINRLSTNYSYFFRETDYIDHMRLKAVPQLLAAGRKSLSVWSAGCAEGQEVYSVAMVLASLARQSGFDFHIIGTDVNTDVLETARSGLYPASDLKSIPVQYRRYVKVTDDGSFQIDDSIKSHVTWKRENLLTAKPPKGCYDLIFCRNVLIYFSPPTRRRVVEVLYHAVDPGGYLYTGTMETMDFRSKNFKYIAPSIYQRGEPQ